jgi:saposin
MLMLIDAATYCSLCQFAVQYIDGYLQQNYTQAQIIKQLEVVCALAPEPFADQCDAFVEQYVPVLIDYIVKYEDPSTACTQLRFCGSFDKEAAAKIIDAMKRSTLPPSLDLRVRWRC